MYSQIMKMALNMSSIGKKKKEYTILIIFI